MVSQQRRAGPTVSNSSFSAGFVKGVQSVAGLKDQLALPTDDLENSRFSTTLTIFKPASTGLDKLSTAWNQWRDQATSHFHLYAGLSLLIEKYPEFADRLAALRNTVVNSVNALASTADRTAFEADQKQFASLRQSVRKAFGEWQRSTSSLDIDGSPDYIALKEGYLAQQSRWQDFLGEHGCAFLAGNQGPQLVK